MPGYYHILTDPGQSTALDGQPDPPDDAVDATLSGPAKTARKRREKFRAVLAGGGPWHPQPMDALGGRWRRDAGQILVETTDAVDPAAVPPYVQPLVVLLNQTWEQITPYLAANPNW
jgi:hypothetical protein